MRRLVPTCVSLSLHQLLYGWYFCHPALMHLPSACNSAWPRWRRMSQSAATCSPTSLCVASASHVGLFHHALFFTTGQTYSRLLYSQTPLSAGAAEKSVFQILVKRQDSKNFVCVSKVDLCVVHACIPDKEGRKWSRVVAASVCPPLLPAIKPVIKVIPPPPRRFRSSSVCWCVDM